MMLGRRRRLDIISPFQRLHAFIGIANAATTSRHRPACHASGHDKYIRSILMTRFRGHFRRLTHGLFAALLRAHKSHAGFSCHHATKGSFWPAAPHEFLLGLPPISQYFLLLVELSLLLLRAAQRQYYRHIARFLMQAGSSASTSSGATPAGWAVDALFTPPFHY